MKKIKLNKLAILSALLLVALVSFANQEKVVQVFRNGEVIKEYDLLEVDYIEINDKIGAPSDVNATVSGNAITITWSAVSGASSYEVYRSADNMNFTLLASGLTKTTYTDNNPLFGTNYYRVKAITDRGESGFSGSAIGTLPNDGLEKGVYLGIIGFNVDLYNYPISQLNESTTSNFYSFVDGLQITQRTGTLLYYAIDEAINTLQAATLPSNLSTAAIVTFTDGIDQGSVMKNPQYNYDDMLYLEGMHNRIMSETVANLPITAYSIGLLGNDVENEDEINLFKKNLNMLASGEDKAFEVGDMTEVNKKFTEIATQLAVSNFIQTITLNAPGVGNGVKLRFTFDDVNNAKDSKLYIEGVLNLVDGSFDDIEFVGMTSTTPNRVFGVLDDLGINYSFTFEGIHTDNNVRITPDFPIKEWRYYASSDSWGRNSEFDPFEDAKIETKRKSAVVMLLLDCSRSLSNSFHIIQENAKNFIKTLAENSVNPDEVTSVSLDRTEVVLPTGETTMLKATIYPTTALLQTVEWSSTNPSVATVDNNGYVKAVSPGTANIIVRTVDGGFTASCKITVVSNN